MDLVVNTLSSDIRNIQTDTVENCALLYTKIEEVKTQFKQEADTYQGMALLAARKLIFGDDYNKILTNHPSGNKWTEFCYQINVSKMQSSRLLEFAGYKEIETEMIEMNPDIKPIETASHFQAAKKSIIGELGKTEATPTKIAETYSKAIEQERPMETAAQVKESTQAVVEDPEEIEFERQMEEERTKGRYRTQGQQELGISTSSPSRPPFAADLGKVVYAKRGDWKFLYKEMSKIAHPDKGGSAGLQHFLNDVNEIMKKAYANDKEWVEYEAKQVVLNEYVTKKMESHI